MANIWRNPIYDRTQEDIDFAINKIAEWITYNISSAEYDEKVRIENEALILREGYAIPTDDKLIVQGDGRAYVEEDKLVVKIGVVYDLKGCVNTLDLNRIEGNVAYLSEKLLEMIYPSNLFVERVEQWDENGQPIIETIRESHLAPDIVTKEWNKGDLPTENDVNRIISNVRSLIDGFYQPSNAPTLPSSLLSYGDVNSIERNIDLIKYLLDCMVNSFNKVGASKSGATMILPLRR